MADENKINDMEELNLEELEKAVGGYVSAYEVNASIGDSTDHGTSSPRVIKVAGVPYAGEMMAKYGTSNMEETFKKMTPEEVMKLYKEATKAKGN